MSGQPLPAAAAFETASALDAAAAHTTDHDQLQNAVPSPIASNSAGAPGMSCTTQSVLHFLATFDAIIWLLAFHDLDRVSLNSVYLCYLRKKQVLIEKQFKEARTDRPRRPQSKDSLSALRPRFHHCFIP
jgi:hypothetical protein